jgi:hypothetical protein
LVLENVEDSFSMFLGCSNKTVNILDNPYFNLNVVEIDQNWSPKISETVKLRKCIKEKDYYFMSETAQGYYPNSACIDNKSQARLSGNWFS